MQQPDTDFTHFRSAALAAGYRTIGAEFDGSGDSGSVNALVLPHSLDNTSLAELSGNFKHTFDEVRETYWDAKFANYVKRTAFTELKALIDVYSIDIDEPFYQILEHFDGDWVNNAGGHGTAWLDLLTGEYFIDGYERYEREEEAQSAGSLHEYCAPMLNPADNTADYIKSLLA